ncbi:hypothetical protein CRUP_008263 [Coryphaenoides rupestris]|nr:hypothetical protein CRUP_008263 [Coryphaenoides rupestris]
MPSRNIDSGRQQQQLVSHLRRLPVRERVCLLRAMPLNLALKIELSSLYVHIVGTWRLLLGALAFLSSVRLWRTQLKLLAGRFGTPVLSYFLFLRMLVLLNLLLFLVNGLFLVLPRALDPLAAGDNSSLLHTHSVLHLLTGGGYVAHSVMFYGYYGNTLSGWSCGPAEHEPEANVSAPLNIAGQPVCGPQVVAPVSYNTSLSYLFTVTSGLFITSIILVYSISQYFGRRFCVFPSHGKLAGNVFCSWDFKVTKEMSVQRQSENISTQLKEQLSEGMCCERGPGFVRERRRLLRARLSAWAACLASVFLSGLAVYHLADHMHDQGVMASVEADLLGESRLLALPTVVSTITLFLPGLFHLVSRVERYDSPLVATYVSIVRNLLLKVGLLGVLCYHWLWRIPSEPERYGLQCWETFVGQELYRLVLVDFFCTLVNAFVGESLWRLFSNRVLKRRRRPTFDVSRHALELVYGQTLTWLGVFFAPLLPVVQLIKLLLLFYVKKTGLTLTCEAPRRPWRASQMTAVFTALLLCPSLLGAAACLTYTVWTVKPSSACGPFRRSPTPLEGQKLLLWQTVDTGADPKLGLFLSAS